MTKRKTRTDSTAGMIQAHSRDYSPIQWPGEVTHLADPADKAAATAHFNKILTARAIEHWRQIDVVTAAQLSNLHVHYDKLAVQLDKEGFIVDDKRSPVFDVAEKVLAKIGQLSRTLSLTGMPTDKRTMDAAHRAEEEAREAKRDRPRMSLLA